MTAASGASADQEDPQPRWRRWAPRVGTLAAGFTALCCLGVAAALSLASSVGATFLTRDASLRPLLAGTLGFTALASALTFWRHRHPGPLILTVVAGLWVYVLTFVAGAPAHGGAAHDSMGGHEHGSAHPGIGGGRAALVWLGLAVLVGAQAWDVLRVRRSQRSLGAAA